ncbi:MULTISPECIES: hypothetical protein [Klebsiella/Raoultella group]|uniref:hypothetical protein n=1 Tax=Klebsiella/Raoultella group TaxID=2890311 RepID=UPI00096A4CC5|nr:MULTISPECIES: hypothetical protein [Klebsiella/Raoultella group]HBZ8800604.1 hypothetical protein [Klebsiella pneumoniae]MCE9799792.1 hypothetical protein [Raoultella ornithinolytica]MCE9810539.1 hypothetical protein [Raoultella ornithinolytica]MCE9867191.1 hypothetical protein [Raoultella ornithinolytica]MCF6707522.1 hypothetical protein [Raoultella ornithinolytica]
MKTHDLFNKLSKGKVLYPFILVFIALNAMSWLSTGAMPTLKPVVLFIIILATPLMMALLAMTRGALMFFLGALVTQVTVAMLVTLFTAHSLSAAAGFGAVSIVIYVLITGFSDEKSDVGKEDKSDS